MSSRIAGRWSHFFWRRVERFHELPAPFLTCEPVLTETFYLVSRLHDGSRRFFELLGEVLQALVHSAIVWSARILPHPAQVRTHIERMQKKFL